MGVFDRFRGRDGAPPGGGSTPGGDDAASRSFDRRHAYWSAVGTVESDVLGHLISPSLMGGPAWPTTRQAYRVVRRHDTIVIASDGMSDPFDSPDAEPVNGFGMELFVETPDIAPDHAGQPGDISGITRSWAFELVSHVAGTVAGAGGILGQLERYGVVSMELPGVSRSSSLGPQIPPGYATTDDSLGVLLGAPVAGFPARIDDMPLSPVSMVPVTLVTADELETLRRGGTDARSTLATALADSGRHHVTRFPSD